jgi:hypothetical protein
MGKLKLNLDDLKVKSFDTSPPAIGSAGTVRGQTINDSGCTDCCGTAGYGCQSGDGCTGGSITDYGSCGESCNGTCNTCYDLTCEVGCPTAAIECTAYNTCYCANDSVPGYESCGTTCQEPSCQYPGTCQPA